MTSGKRSSSPVTFCFKKRMRNARDGSCPGKEDRPVSGAGSHLRALLREDPGVRTLVCGPRRVEPSGLLCLSSGGRRVLRDLQGHQESK